MGSAPAGRIGVLDGWRAIAAAMVIVSHVFAFWTIGRLGVEVFFAISGYVICRGFLLEHERYGRISLTAFYVRRALRILPPLLFYVIVIVALAYSGLVAGEAKGTLRALTFTCNLQNCGGWIGDHTWSLSVEEQFYLVIPMLFVIGGTFFRPAISAAVACVPLAVVAFYLAKMPVGAELASMFLTIAFAVGYALHETRLRAIVAALPLFGWVAAVIAVFVLAAWSGSRAATLATIFVQPFLLVLIPMWTTAKPSGVAITIGSRPLQAFGVISYGVYLWQEPVTAPGTAVYLKLLGVAGACVLAYVSYWTVEVRLIALGRRASNALRRPGPPLGQALQT